MESRVCGASQRLKLTANSYIFLSSKSQNVPFLLPSPRAINILFFWTKSIKLGVVFSPSVYSLHRTASGSLAGGIPPDPKNNSSFATQKRRGGEDSLPTTICFANRPAGLCLCGQTYRRCGRARRFASLCGLLLQAKISRGNCLMRSMEAKRNRELWWRSNQRRGASWSLTTKPTRAAC